MAIKLMPTVGTAAVAARLTRFVLYRIHERNIRE